MPVLYKPSIGPDDEIQEDPVEKLRSEKIEEMRKLHIHFLKMYFSEKDKRKFVAFKNNLIIMVVRSKPPLMISVL